MDEITKGVCEDRTGEDQELSLGTFLVLEVREMRRPNKEDEEGAASEVRGKPGESAVWKPSEECISKRKAWPTVSNATDRSSKKSPGN